MASDFHWTDPIKQRRKKMAECESTHSHIFFFPPPSSLLSFSVWGFHWCLMSNRITKWWHFHIFFPSPFFYCCLISAILAQSTRFNRSACHGARFKTAVSPLKYRLFRFIPASFKRAAPQFSKLQTKIYFSNGISMRKRVVWSGCRQPAVCRVGFCGAAGGGERAPRCQTVVSPSNRQSIILILTLLEREKPA